MSRFDYDLIVIGAGSGGISSAILSNNLGKTTALVEKQKIGGECTWTGCVPSKALIRAAETAHKVQQMQRLGLRSEATASLNTDGVMDHVRSVIQQVYEEETPQVFEDKGIDVYIGGAEFVDPHTIKTGDAAISGKSFIISTGSSPRIPEIPGVEDIDYLTNETLFDLPKLPQSLLVIGGGPIGVEMAQAMNRLGVEVTLVQRSTLLKKDDRELVDLLTKHLRSEGVTVHLNTRPQRVSQTSNGVILHAKHAERGEFELQAEQVLMATGRIPNVETLQLQNAGVRYSNRGIHVNPKLQTSASHIYAIGDVINGPLFSHAAEYQATLAVQNAVLPLPIKKKAEYDWIPWVTFSAPELAHVGLTEKEARTRWGDSIRVYDYDYKNVDRAKTDLHTLGKSKFVFDPKGKLVGAHILGYHAAELLHEAMLTRFVDASFDKLGQMVHAYPTYGDVIKRPSTAFYVDRLQNKFIIKVIKKLVSK